METAAADGAGGASGSPNGGSSGDGAGAAGLMTHSLQKETGKLSSGDGEITGHDDTHALSASFRMTLSGPKALCNRLREIAKTVRCPLITRLRDTEAWC